jgi:hypothetical protein
VAPAPVLAGGGELADGDGLPEGGNCPPPELASCCLLVTALRAGLLFASFKAPAKSWLFAWVAWPADADALGCRISLPRCV